MTTTDVLSVTPFPLGAGSPQVGTPALDYLGFDNHMGHARGVSPMSCFLASSTPKTSMW